MTLASGIRAPSMCQTWSCLLEWIRQMSCLHEPHPPAGETGTWWVLTNVQSDTHGEGRNHAFWWPAHHSNQKNTAISLEISLFKFNSRRRSTAVPFPNWNSPPMCFWEAQMPWRFPSDNNRDCSQLWMVLVDFSSNKNHESFHNFWNCKEITNTPVPERKKNGHIMKRKVV